MFANREISSLLRTVKRVARPAGVLGRQPLCILTEKWLAVVESQELKQRRKGWEKAASPGSAGQQINWTLICKHFQVASGDKNWLVTETYNQVKPEFV